MARVLGVKVDDLRAQDIRPPIDEIKRMTQRNPKYALAFRTMIDKKISADELLDLAKQKEAPKHTKPKE